MLKQVGGGPGQGTRPHQQRAGDTDCIQYRQNETTVAVDEAPLLLSGTAAARLLGVTPQTLWRLAKAGRIPRVILSRRPYYRREDLISFVASLPEVEP